MGLTLPIFEFERSSHSAPLRPGYAIIILMQRWTPLLRSPIPDTRNPIPDDMAGYSRRSLVDKLGIKPGTHIAILNAPRGYRGTLGQLPAGVHVVTTARGNLPFIH